MMKLKMALMVAGLSLATSNVMAGPGCIPQSPVYQNLQLNVLESQWAEDQFLQTLKAQIVNDTCSNGLLLDLDDTVSPENLTITVIVSGDNGQIKRVFRPDPSEIRQIDGATTRINLGPYAPGTVVSFGAVLENDTELAFLGIIEIQ